MMVGLEGKEHRLESWKYGARIRELKVEGQRAEGYGGGGGQKLGLGGDGKGGEEETGKVPGGNDHVYNAIINIGRHNPFPLRTIGLSNIGQAN